MTSDQSMHDGRMIPLCHTASISTLHCGTTSSTVSLHVTSDQCMMARMIPFFHTASMSTLHCGTTSSTGSLHVTSDQCMMARMISFCHTASISTLHCGTTSSTVSWTSASQVHVGERALEDGRVTFCLQYLHHHTTSVVYVYVLPAAFSTLGNGHSIWHI